MAIDGTYIVQIDTPLGTQTATLTFKTDGNALSGSASSQLGQAEFGGGSVDGDNVAWQMKINSPLGEMDLEFNGKISGDEISGEVVLGNFGTSSFQGKRV